jgi:rhodanese-related sulfurtransferase
MVVEHDTSARFSEYAHPERLVSTDWLAEHLDSPGLVVVESDEDVLLYETGHIPGAVKIDWHLDLNDPVRRDYIDGEGFARLMSSKGITRDTTIVVYGDKNNWWAAYALWVFSLFGHDDVRLLDGGRAAWEAEGREYTTEAPEPEPTDYPVVERDDSVIRAYKDDVLAHLGKPLIDVRSPEEYSGPPTPTRAPSAPATSPRPRTSPGGRPPPTTGGSGPPPSSTRSTATAPASSRVTRSSPTAASASGRATPGSSCTTSWASRTSATTTAPGPNGAAPSASRSCRAASPERSPPGDDRRSAPLARRDPRGVPGPRGA